jgi:ribonuclease HI
VNGLRLVRRESDDKTADDYTPLVAIYADASCLRNGSPDAAAGCGAVVIDRNRMELKLVAKYLPGAMTYRQAEILACVRALEELRRPCRVEICSDSQYVIDTMNGKNRMKTNRPYWEALVEQSYGHHIAWRWIKGHDGATFHEAADRLARAASTTRTDLTTDDLDSLAKHLSAEGNQLNIRSFEIDLDKIVSRFGVAGGSHDRDPGLGHRRRAAFPSAFSA